MERRRTSWLSSPIGAPSLRPGGPGFAGFRARFTDPKRWRIAGYFLLAPFVFLTLVLSAVLGLGLSLYLVTFPIWGWAVGVGPLGLVISVVAGVLLAGVGPRVAQVAGALGVSFVARMLGPDRIQVMQDRVDVLASNREEILSAVAAERRRIERNLHDGVQQRLVAVGIDLGLAAHKLDTDPEAVGELLQSARDRNRETIGELRTIGRGLHPAVLDDRGLDAALSAVVSSAPIPISLDVDAELELPIDVAETTYFVVSEAVANVLKHAAARTASINVHGDRDVVRVRIHDDGRGGADARRGTGLAGMAARVRGADGTITIDSPPGGPTVLSVELPNG